jgi:hypothetical protein
MVGDYEFIAAALGASERVVRHGACRPFWSALANRLVFQGLGDELRPQLCTQAAGSQAFLPSSVPIAHESEHFLPASVGTMTVLRFVGDDFRACFVIC